jgi:RNA recognition motif-containing protein
VKAVLFMQVKTPGNKSNVSGGGGKKLFVGNLSFRATEDTLYEFFKAAGPVSDVYIAQDDNGSRGFGFVRMDTEEGVAKALELNGQYLEGREVHCEVAREREDRSQSAGKNWNSPAGENAGFTPNPRPGADRTVFVRGFDKFQDEDTVSRSVSLAAGMQ